MKLPKSAHTSRPWRIHEIAGDFRLEDVWELPTPGRRGDFRFLVEEAARLDPEEGSSLAVRRLFSLRWTLGRLFGWDDAEAGPDSAWPTLRERLPDDLRYAPYGPEFEALPFQPLYLLEDEFAAEIANRTMHGILHLAWIPDGSGAYRGQMAVYVKRKGLFGAAYMAAIGPFRHLIVFPRMLREVEREWPQQPGQALRAP